ncbi:tyrosine-type recombinase/integrase [Parasutterella muris]|uniref:tyrosine-type recombinase/integrase n=1 Tax=Parasutterella muris TaxID=2565572 RepID=UPI00203D4BFC|nr:Arm DNA-binding domain-containing protein [Parasutterella muris]
MAKLRSIDISKLPDGFHADENGLYLFVRGNSRTWVYRVTVYGKRIKRGLGSAKTISLAQTRQKVLDIKTNGVKEVTHGKKFKDFYLDVVEHTAKIKQWKNPKSKSQWTNTIETYAVPYIGNKLVSRITRDDIRGIIEPIYTTKTETASRLIGRLKAVFDYAQVCGLHSGHNPAVWVGNLDLFFAPKAKVAKVKHPTSIGGALSWKTTCIVF